MSEREGHRVATIMTVLAVAEPGKDFTDDVYGRPEPVIGWELPITWYLNDPPKEGRIQFRYDDDTAGGEHDDWKCRASMRRHFLVFNNWRDEDPERIESGCEDQGGVPLCEAANDFVTPEGEFTRVMPSFLAGAGLEGSIRKSRT